MFAGHARNLGSKGKALRCRGDDATDGDLSALAELGHFWSLPLLDLIDGCMSMSHSPCSWILDIPSTSKSRDHAHGPGFQRSMCCANPQDASWQSTVQGADAMSPVQAQSFASS